MQNTVLKKNFIWNLPGVRMFGPVLFNISLSDLFKIMGNIVFASHADGNTPYDVGSNIEKLSIELQIAPKTLLKWLADNQMKANPDKCNFSIKNHGNSYIHVFYKKTIFLPEPQLS